MPTCALSGSYGSDVETCPVYTLILLHGFDLGLLGFEILLWTLISGAAWLAWASFRITRWGIRGLNNTPGLYAEMTLFASGHAGFALPSLFTTTTSSYCGKYMLLATRCLFIGILSRKPDGALEERYSNHFLVGEMRIMFSGAGIRMALGWPRKVIFGRACLRFGVRDNFHTQVVSAGSWPSNTIIGMSCCIYISDSEESPNLSHNSSKFARDHDHVT
jgi:hypothetical protein